MSNFKYKEDCSKLKSSSFSLKEKYESSNQRSDSNLERESEYKINPKDDSVKKIPTSETNQEDPNILGAKLIKAELMGDDDLIKSLKIRLEAARKNADEKKEAEKELKLNSVDYSKKPNEKEFQNHSRKHSKNHQNRNKSHHDRKSDDFESRILSRNYKGPTSDDEDEYISSKKLKKGKQIESSNLKKEKDEDSSQCSVENCKYCFENFEKHLVICLGKHCYLALPSIQSLVEGNCFVAPINHCSSCVTCDEEVWFEIQEFRRALVKMFDTKSYDCIFFEQYSKQKKFSHLVIECVPLGRSVSNMAPIYFKKALIESESEWAHNKSIIDLSKQNIRKSIPKNMPYFTVSFGLDDGYAHVIENDNSFPDYFAKEVIGGILDLDPLMWRRPKKDEFSIQSHKVIEFIKWWKPYDFTKN